MNRRKSSGVVPAGSEPSATMRSRMSGRSRILTNSSCSRVTMALGSPAGPITPYQPTTSKPGSTSATAGRSGNAARRLGAVTASPRSFPDRTRVCTDCMPAKLKWYCPASRSISAGPEPL